MPERLFMLDCDGTLLATIEAWHEAERHVARVAGIELTKEERDLLNTFTLEEVSDFFHERYGVGEGAADVLRFVNEFMLDYYRTQSQPVPGAVEFVRAAREAGIALAVLSSSPYAFLEAGLQRAGIMQLFDEVVSVDDLGVTKRDPSTYALVCERLGVAPQQAWLFDDSWYALAAAREAGCNTVGVYSTDWCATRDELAHHAERVLDDFTDLDVAAFK